MTAPRPPAIPWISRRGALSAAWGACIAAIGPRSVMAQEATKIHIQLDQQALNAVPARERAGLEVMMDTSPAAENLKARSLPGKAVPIIYLIAGILSIPSIWAAVQEMLRHHEYGGVVIDTRTTPADIHHDQALPAELVMVIRADSSTETVRSTLATQDFLNGVLSSHRQ